MPSIRSALIPNQKDNVTTKEIVTPVQTGVHYLDRLSAVDSGLRRNDKEAHRNDKEAHRNDKEACLQDKITFQNSTINRLGIVLSLLLALTLASCQPKAQGGLVYASSDEGNWEIYLHQPAKDKESKPESLNLSRYPSSDRYPDWSPDRTQLVFASDRKGSFDLYLLSADGEDLRLLSESPYPDTTPRWSPDGKQIVFVSDREDRNEDIYTIDPAGQNIKRLTKDPAQDYDPAWFPDGTSVVYVSLRSGKPELFRQSLTGEATQLSKNGKDKRSPDVSPNGNLIVYSEQNGTQWQLVILDLSSGTSKALLPDSKQRQLSPRWLTDQEILFTQFQTETQSGLYRVSLKDLSVQAETLKAQQVREASWKQSP